MRPFVEQAAENVQDKQKWETWVCSQFLCNLGVSFDDRDVQSHPEQDNAIDVVFRDARFQVKTKYDDGRRMHDDHKRAVVAVSGRPTAEALAVISRDVDLKEISPAEIATFVRKMATDEVCSRSGTDLLVYINLLDRVLAGDDMTAPSSFGGIGWRSISALICSGSLVFYASPGAPKFLRDRIGTVTVRSGHQW